MAGVTFISDLEDQPYHAASDSQYMLSTGSYQPQMPAPQYTPQFASSKHTPYSLPPGPGDSPPELDIPPPLPPLMQLGCTCVDVLRHTESCDLCRKLYRQDRMLYLIIIAALVVICILLFKRVMHL